MRRGRWEEEEDKKRKRMRRGRGWEEEEDEKRKMRRERWEEENEKRKMRRGRWEEEDEMRGRWWWEEDDDERKMRRGRWEEEDDDVDVEGEEEDDDVEEDDVEEDDVEEEDRSQDRDAHFVRTCAVEMHMDMWHVTRGILIILCRNLQGKCRTLPDANSEASILCEPAQSKCTWTCHKRHFVRKFTGKMPDTSDTTCIEHRALTPTVRTPQCGHTVWGINQNKQPSYNIVLHCSSHFTIYGSGV